MEIRKGREEDLPRIGWLYSQARRAMGEAGHRPVAERGLPQRDRRQEKTWTRAGATCWKKGERVIAVACLAFGHEPTYDEIEGEGWERDDPFYGFLHRIAVAPEAKGRGSGRAAVRRAEAPGPGPGRGGDPGGHPP